MLVKLTKNSAMGFFTATNTPPPRPYITYKYFNKVYYFPVANEGNSKFRILGKIPIRELSTPPESNGILYPDLPAGEKPSGITGGGVIERTKNFCRLFWSYTGNTQLTGFKVIDANTDRVLANNIKRFEFSLENASSGFIQFAIVAVGTTGKESDYAYLGVPPA